MTIHEVFSRFSIPLNLQQHMLRVGAVGQLIVDSFNQPSFEPDLVVKTLLLHDLGNILKFNFDRPELLDPTDRSRIQELKAIQTSVRNRFGSETDQATLEMIKEVTDENRIVELCASSHGEHLSEFLHNHEWDRKIAFYADMRVGPFGILSLDDRFADLKQRYPHEQTQIEIYHQQSCELEQQLQTQTEIDLQAIDDAQVDPLLPVLLDKGL